jgi:glycosyltransferase involved in cell wall biosynthesis
VTVCALIAAFNEAATIAAVVSGVAPHVDHVVVVDDGSTDGTASLAAAAGAEVVRHPTNQGKGAAIRSGLQVVLARPFSHVLLLDGDGQHDPQEAPRLIAAAEAAGADLVIGERPFSKATMPRSRYYTNTISSWVISKVFIGTTVGDAQSGYRLVAADCLRSLRLSGRGYEIETEMLIKLTRSGARVGRVPIGLRYGHSRSKLRPLRDTTRTCFLAVRYRFFPKRLQ